MDNIITLICIIGLCIIVYSYQMMRHKYRDYPTYCNVIYLPRSDKLKKDISPHMEVLEHEKHDNKFINAKYNTAPKGISEIENIIPTLNRRYDQVLQVEMN